MSGGTLLFPNFCVMLFQYGGQRRKLRLLQLGKVRLVAKHQITAGNEPVIKLFFRDLTVMLCRLDQVCHVIRVLHLPGEERELMQQAVKMHLVTDMLFVGFTVDHMFHILSLPFLIRFPRRGRPRRAWS